MPFYVSTQQGSSPLNNSHIDPLPSADTSPEMHLWGQVKVFFDSTQESDALTCIRNICRQPASTMREGLANRFEQLRALAYPGYKENIQSGRHGENHFCILGENGQEVLSVTLGDTGTYEVVYEGRRIGDPFIQSQQEPEAETENTAEAPIITHYPTAEECEVIWSEWENDCQHREDDSGDANRIRDELKARKLVAKKLRRCLDTNSTSVILYGIHALSDLPQALPPHITELIIKDLKLITSLPPLPPKLVELNVDNIPLDSFPVLPQELESLSIEQVTITELPELPPKLQTVSMKDIPLARLPTLPNGLTTLELIDLNNVTSLPQMPHGLTELKIVHLNNVTSLPQLPHELTVMIVNGLNITRLPELPSGLQNLSINSLPLTELPLLPSGLRDLSIKSLPLAELPPLPPALRDLSIKSLPLAELPPLPSTLRVLSINSLPLAELPPLPSGVWALSINSLPLTELPPLPYGLEQLTVKDMPLTSGLENIVRLPSTARVRLEGTTISEHLIQTLLHLTSGPFYSGPRIDFDNGNPSFPPRSQNAAHNRQ